MILELLEENYANQEWKRESEFTYYANINQGKVRLTKAIIIEKSQTEKITISLNDVIEAFEDDSGQFERAKKLYEKIIDCEWNKTLNGNSPKY